MTEFTQRLIECAEREWRYFGETTRNSEDQWHLAGNEADEPFRSHISHYWASVDQAELDGGSPDPWSAAFISWCFKIAGAGARFSPDDTHSKYINSIRLHEGMSELLVLRPPLTTPLAPGDLIWNSRQPDAAHFNPNIPDTYEGAIEKLAGGHFFASHVDIVVTVGADRCDSIGGNVWPPAPSGGSVTRSTWRLNGDHILADERKDWIGVVKNGL